MYYYYQSQSSTRQSHNSEGFRYIQYKYITLMLRKYDLITLRPLFCLCAGNNDYIYLQRQSVRGEDESLLIRMIHRSHCPLFLKPDTTRIQIMISSYTSDKHIHRAHDNLQGWGKN